MNMKTPVLLLMLLGCIGCSEQTTLEHSFPYNPKSTFIKSAHYFSSAWPKTFWQEFERADVQHEIAQIKRDGFNTIVLTVPWRGFETNFRSTKTDSVKVMYDRLDFLLDTITNQQMMFILRVGFPHDYTPNTGSSIAKQCEGIYTDSRTQAHWKQYLVKLKKVVKNYEYASAGVLVSWEDFWCPHFVFPHQNEQERLDKAQKIGYGDWLKNKNPNILKVLLGVNELKYDQLKIPKKNESSYVYYIEFIDQMLDQKILRPTQEVFPHASLEIRVDKDPVHNGDQKIWIGHDLYLDDTNHKGTYWAPFWGASNQGELLSAEQALITFEYFLKYITGDGKNINHVIEQFNFYDNTPYFPNNANIKPDEIDDFLAGAAPLLKAYSQGAGVWAYRDYADNALYNASFEMGLDGWHTEGIINLVGDANGREVSMTPGSSIDQSFYAAERFMLISQYETVNFCFTVGQSSKLEVLVNNQPLIQKEATQGKNCWLLDASLLKSTKQVNFKVVSKSPATIDELSLHGFTQKLGLYQSNGEAGQYIPAYRKLNNALLD